MNISQFMARQYAHPSGLFGRVFTAVYLNRVNRASNNAVYLSLEPRRGDRVLEVGFGGAELLFDMGRRSGCSELCGVEKSEDMVRRALSRLDHEKFPGTVELCVGSVEALPFMAGRFDRVCSVNTLYFWSDVDRGARELARVTADSGRVVLGYGSGEKLAKSGYTEKGFRFYSSERVDQAMASAGFTLKHVNRMQRKNKDPFIISVYGRNARSRQQPDRH